MADSLRLRVGKRIRSLRRRRGWRQIDLATHADISNSHISNIENGKRELCLDTLERIAIAFSVPPADLFK